MNSTIFSREDCAKVDVLQISVVGNIGEGLFRLVIARHHVLEPKRFPLCQPSPLFDAKTSLTSRIHNAQTEAEHRDREGVKRIVEGNWFILRGPQSQSARNGIEAMKIEMASGSYLIHLWTMWISHSSSCPHSNPYPHSCPNSNLTYLPRNLHLHPCSS